MNREELARLYKERKAREAEEQRNRPYTDEEIREMQRLDAIGEQEMHNGTEDEPTNRTEA